MLKSSMRLLAAIALAGAAFAQDPAAAIDDYLKSVNFTGTALASHDGKVVFSKAYGLANREWDIPNTPDTKFRLASITKTFTATAILQLLEKEKLSLDDPAVRWIPTAHESWKPVTIRHLLSHTGGVPSYTSLPGFSTRQRIAATPAEIISTVKDNPLEFAPGAKYNYSNSGYVILGIVLEAVTGKPYATLLKDAIFDPAGMSDSGYDDSAAILKRRASGHASNGNNAPPIDMSFPFSAGALYSTTGDLFKYDRALAAGKLLSAKTLDLAATPVLGNYGLGWVSITRDGRRSVGHAGGINGFSTIFLRFPATAATVILLSNQEGPPVDPHAWNVARLLHGEKPPVPRKEIPMTPESFDPFTGEYRFSPAFSMKVRRDGTRFLTQATNQREIEVFPMSPDTFCPKVMDAEIQFVRDPAGNVTHLVLRQGGREMKALKEN